MHFRPDQAEGRLALNAGCVSSATMAPHVIPCTVGVFFSGESPAGVAGQVFIGGTTHREEAPNEDHRQVFVPRL